MSIKKSYTVDGVHSVEDIKCLSDIVIVKPVEEKEIGGIIIPETSAEKGQKGTVCRVGPGEEGFEMEVSEGDKILHVKYAGSEVKIEGQKYLIMRQGDVLGKYCGPRDIDLIPLEERVLIEWEYGQDEYKGTTILRAEGSSKERYFTGVIAAISPKVTTVSVGERIFFNQFCGPERIEFGGKRYAMIWEKDAYCVLPLRKDVVVLSH